MSKENVKDLLGRVKPIHLPMQGLAGWDKTLPRWDIRARETPTITITKYPDDPGAVYFHFMLLNGTVAMLRGVYDATTAKHVPDAKKPKTAVYELPVEGDTLTVMVGNYNITEDLDLESDEDDHWLVDDIMKLMEDCTVIKTWHDTDGFARLIRKHRGYRRNKKWFTIFPPNRYQAYFGDIDVICRLITANDDSIAAIITAIPLYTDARVNVSYTGRDDGCGIICSDVAVSVMSDPAMMTITSVMRDKMGFSEKALGEFLTQFTDFYVPSLKSSAYMSDGDMYE